MFQYFRSLMIHFLNRKRQMSFSAFPWLVGAVGFVLTLFLYFPGEWSYDASVQHAQAVSGLYGDWHPPVMAASLRWSNIIFNGIFQTNYSGTGVLFTVYSAMLWGGITCVLISSRPFWEKLREKPCFYSLIPLLLLIIILCTDIFPWSASFSKDTGMLGAYAFGIGREGELLTIFQASAAEKTADPHG